jgi:hypothetical protein
MGCHSQDSAPTRDHEDDPDFLSFLLNIMSCHLVCICDTLFNTYDPPIETGLICLMCRMYLFSVEEVQSKTS